MSDVSEEPVEIQSTPVIDRLTTLRIDIAKKISIVSNWLGNLLASLQIKRRLVLVLTVAFFLLVTHSLAIVAGGVGTMYYAYWHSDELSKSLVYLGIKTREFSKEPYWEEIDPVAWDVPSGAPNKAQEKILDKRNKQASGKKK